MGKRELQNEIKFEIVIKTTLNQLNGKIIHKNNLSKSLNEYIFI